MSLNSHLLSLFKYSKCVRELNKCALQDLSVNSFEQLCINFANEQLQQFVNKALVAQEQVSVSSAIILTIYSHIFPSLEANYENINTLSRLYYLDLMGTCFNLHLPIPMGPAIVILEIPYHKCGFSDTCYALEIINTLGNKTSGWLCVFVRRNTVQSRSSGIQ